MGNVELCSGCGAVAPQHPMVGVARDTETGEWAAFPVCLPCWSTPAHRTALLKMHFFERADAPLAVQSAANNIMVSPASPPAPAKKKR